MDLKTILQDNGFTPKQAKVYLAGLEMGNAPASSIARHCGENRVTVYTILKELVKQSIAFETTKQNTKYYSVLKPNTLIKQQKQKTKKLEEILPQLNAITNSYNQKPKVFFYEGFEQTKKAFLDIAKNNEVNIKIPYLTFIGSDDVDPRFEKFVQEEFISYRMANPKKTKAIISKKSSVYNKYHKEKHDYVVIDDPIFDMGNEIVLYGKSRIAILLYSNKEFSALIIQSQTLFNGLKNIFNLLRKLYK